MPPLDSSPSTIREVKNLKVIACIDAANIILSCKRIGLEIDFLKLKKYLEDKFRIDEIYYFTANLKALGIELEILRENYFRVVLIEVHIKKEKTPANT